MSPDKCKMLKSNFNLSPRCLSVVSQSFEGNLSRHNQLWLKPDTPVLNLKKVEILCLQQRLHTQYFPKSDGNMSKYNVPVLFYYNIG